MSAGSVAAKRPHCFTGSPAREVLARDPPQLRIQNIGQAIQRVPIAGVPGREHSGDIRLALVRHAGGHFIKKSASR